MPVITKDSHFNLADAWMRGLPSNPEITIQPAFARYRCGELHFRLKDNACLYRKCPDRTKLFQPVEQKVIQFADVRLFPSKVICQTILSAGVVAVDRGELSSAVRANP